MERNLWKDNQRTDKPHLSINQVMSGEWVIQINGTTAISFCPCCMKPFAKREQAMRVVDVFWPGDANDRSGEATKPNVRLLRDKPEATDDN